MPVLGKPRGERLSSPTESVGRCARRPNSAWVRLRVAVHRGELTRALAEGADPGATYELAVRGRQLTSQRYRRALARSLRRTIAEAHKLGMTRAQIAVINRGAVLGAEDALVELIERLGSPNPVQARGMAILERILTNADRSPLYNSCGPGALRGMVCAAAAAMDAPSGSSHEFELAV
jgi:hypothetical protein